LCTFWSGYQQQLHAALSLIGALLFLFAGCDCCCGHVPPGWHFKEGDQAEAHCCGEGVMQQAAAAAAGSSSSSTRWLPVQEVPGSRRCFLSELQVQVTVPEDLPHCGTCWHIVPCDALSGVQRCSAWRDVAWLSFHGGELWLVGHGGCFGCGLHAK
jgi:hypothetical protein